MNLLNKIENKVFAIIKIIYEKFFGVAITSGVCKFIRNIYWSFLGTLVSTFIMFLVHILGGRFIGPIEYGKFSLIFSIATFLVLPIVLGFPAATKKYLAQTITEKKNIISTAYFIVILLSIFWLGIYLIMQKVIINAIRINNNIFLLSLVFAGIFVWYQMTEATMQGLLKIKKNSLIKIISFLSLFLIFIFILFFKKNLNYRAIYIPITAAYFLFSLLVLINLKKYFFSLSGKWAKLLFHFGFYAILGQFFFVIITNVDKLLINYFLSLKEVGIYQSYLTSAQAINLIITPFIAVYFPTVVKAKDKYNIFRKINKLALPVFIVVFFFLLATIFIILKLYGKRYPIHFSLIALFALSGGFFAVHSLYSFLLGSKDIKGMKMVSGFLFLGMIVNFIFNLIFIPLIGIYGAAGATALTYGILVLLYVSTRGKILQ